MFTKLRVKLFLSSWKKKRGYIIPEGKEELYKGKEDLYIRRVSRLHDIYVDLYWYVKKDKSSSHEDFVYRRCAYEMVRENVESVEENELPNAILDFEV